MPIKLYKTISINKDRVPAKWIVVDVANQVVGRIASHIARLLKGKDKPFYTPHVDCGVHVVVINAAKVVFTGNKEKGKYYQRYTGFPGGKRKQTPEVVRSKHPTRIMQKAIQGMLCRNRLSREILRKKLHIYPGPIHPHLAQTKLSKQ